MAQYLISVLDDTTDSATAEEMAAIDAFNEQLKADGHWVFAGGLASPSTATVVDGRDGERGVHRRALPGVEGVRRRLLDHRGPDLDVALRLAAAGSKSCNRRVELRPFLGA